MKEIKYEKLVRDKIPKIIQGNKQQAVYSILSDIEFKTLLDKKLDEEVQEYQQSKELEELADIIEVIYAIVTSCGNTVEELETIRKQKISDKGAFQDKIILHKTIINR